MKPRSVLPFALGLACAVAALALPAAPAAAGPASQECWDGTWEETGPPGTQRFAFRLRLLVRGERASGEFTWRQIHVSWDPRGNGSIGQEFVRGTKQGDRLVLEGYRVTEGSNLATDRYRIDLGPGGRITGRSASLENDWTARLSGQRVSCAAGRRRPSGGQGLPLPG